MFNLPFVLQNVARLWIPWSSSLRFVQGKLSPMCRSVWGSLCAHLYRLTSFRSCKEVCSCAGYSGRIFQLSMTKKQRRNAIFLSYIFSVSTNTLQIFCQITCSRTLYIFYGPIYKTKYIPWLLTKEIVFNSE